MSALKRGWLQFFFSLKIPFDILKKTPRPDYAARPGAHKEPETFLNGFIAEGGIFILLSPTISIFMIIISVVF